MSIVNVSYRSGCNNCFATDMARHSILVTGRNQDYFLGRSEFSVKQELLQWRKEDEYECSFCGSPYVELRDIQVNDIKLYDFNQIVSWCKRNGGWVFMVDAVKKKGVITISNGGSPVLDKGFVKDSLIKINSTILHRDEGFYKSNDGGAFFACVTGAYNNNGGLKRRIERFYSFGFTKEEILHVMDKVNYEVVIAQLKSDENSE